MPNQFEDLYRQTIENMVEPNPEGSIRQGSWLDFSPSAKEVLGFVGLEYEPNSGLSFRPGRKLLEAYQKVKSPVTRPETAFEWGDTLAGAAAATAETAMAAAAFNPVISSMTEMAPTILGNESGQIRGLPSKLAKIVRKAMQNELKARGPAPFEASTSTFEQQYWKKFGTSPPDTETAKASLMENELKALPEALYAKVKKVMALDTSEGNIPRAINEVNTVLKSGYFSEFSAPEVAQLSSTMDKALSIYHQPLKEADVTSRLLRGSWYRGQDKYPTSPSFDTVIDTATGKEVADYSVEHFGRRYGGDAPTFAGLKAKQSNLGEPHGISLSYDPHVSTGFGPAPQTISTATKDEVIEKVGQGLLPDNLVNRAARLADTQKVSRVMPLYGEAPEGKILQAWKPEHGAEFRAAYADSAKEMAEKYPEFRKSIEKLNPGASGSEIKEAIENVGLKKVIDVPHHIDEAGAIQPTTWKELAGVHGEKYKSPRDELNSLMSKKLMEKGYKGMLHSPHRYQEYELRMFDPYDVMYIDKRAVNSNKYSSNPMSSKAVARLDEMKSALKREHETVTEGKSKTLADWYRDITREEILGLPKVEKVDRFSRDLGTDMTEFSKKPDNVLEDAQQALKEFYGDTGHGDMTDKAQTTVAQLEWGKLNKLKQDAYGTYKQYFGKHSSYDDFTDIWKIFSSNPNAVTFDEFLKQY